MDKKNKLIYLNNLEGVGFLEDWNKKMLSLFLESGYYLGCQLAFDSECHMFINFNSKKDTGRGNIEVFEDGTINWFYTIFTNTEKEQFILDINKTPEWFKKIYIQVMGVKDANKSSTRTA